MAFYHNPVKVYFGPGEMDKLPTILKASGRRKRILLLTGSSSLKASGQLEKIMQKLTDYEVSLFEQIPSNPDVSDIYRIKTVTDSFDYDTILTVGGGSVIDTGKALAAFTGQHVTSVDTLRIAIQEKRYLNNSYNHCPLIAVPTTAGTGSEVTSWATVWDKLSDAKYSITDTALYPEVAIIDPLLTLKLPRIMTAASALDALSHATEAYWSKNTNEIVRLYAIRAIEYIVQNLADVLDNPEDLHLRTNIAYGSLFAGLAFSNTRTTACHAISYPLTLRYGVNHGVAVCMTLGKMLLRNEKEIIHKEELLRAYGVNHAEEVEQYIQRIFAKAGLSSRLRDYGISQDDLSFIADQSYTPGRMDNNPVDVDRQYLLDLLKNIY
jgi:phosphonate metabolism-associated iron-containing alcohol dehydrogenase